MSPGLILLLVLLPIVFFLLGVLFSTSRLPEAKPGEVVHFESGDFVVLTVTQESYGRGTTVSLVDVTSWQRSQ